MSSPVEEQRAIRAARKAAAKRPSRFTPERNVELAAAASDAKRVAKEKAKAAALKAKALAKAEK